MTAPMAIRVEVLGDVVLSRRFLRTGENTDDFSDQFRTIFNHFERATGDQFDSQGSEMGTPWAPLADSTIASKEAKGYADPTQALVATGALALSFQGGPGGVREIGRHEAEWGSRDDKALYHHGRSRSASNPVPRRPIFELDEAARRYVVRVLQESVFG